MSKRSDHDLKQMIEDWQGRQPEPVVRSLLKRTLDELRVARDRLNQNPNNSSRPSGSMAPWLRGDAPSEGVTSLAQEQAQEPEEQEEEDQDRQETTQEASTAPSSPSPSPKTNGTQDSRTEPPAKDASTKALATPEAITPPLSVRDGPKVPQVMVACKSLHPPNSKKSTPPTVPRASVYLP
jgi:hypothetical protein